MPENETAELPLLDNPRTNTVLVEDETTLVAAVSELSRLPGPFAIDAERASGYKYFPSAYLIQIYRSGGPIFLIDPAAFGDNKLSTFGPLARLLESDEWILHAATQDLPCLSELGLVPQKIFDTELASRLLGLERVGLGSICENILGLRLAKEHSAVDWSTRPLREEWLTYAALDVDVLHDLRDSLWTRLVDAEKDSWALQEFELLVRFKPKAKDGERWRSMSGLHAIKDRRKLAIAKNLWNARDELAQKLDVSPGRLVPDSSFIEAANQSPRTRAELLANKNFSGRASRSYADLWWRAIETGLNQADLPELKVPSSQIPHHRFWKQKFPVAHARLERAREVVQEISTVRCLPSENLINPDSLRQICWDVDLTDVAELEGKLRAIGVRPWQIALVAGQLAISFADLATYQEIQNQQS